MINITEENKNKCCGCTACYSVCPVNAITMKKDYEGFLYPEIDKNKCINCGLCEKTCPIKNKLNNNNEPKAYIMRSKEENILKTSTSGGAFTPIAEFILENNGIVFGVGYDQYLNVIHKSITKKEELQELRGSKYVQSTLGETFKKIKKYLEDDFLVLFSGTPCQIEGLKKYLKKNYEKLYTIDVICHGTPSPKLWKDYINYQESKYKSKIKEAYFRHKTYGYHSGTMKLVFKNNKKYYGSARTDYMLKSFFSEISSRPSCYDCQFKSKKHISDFTIYDCWSFEKLTNKKDDDKGYTNILINTTKAENLFNVIQNRIECYNVDNDTAIKYDGSMVEKSAVPNKYRKEFYYTLNKERNRKNNKKIYTYNKKRYNYRKNKKIFI